MGHVEDYSAPTIEWITEVRPAGIAKYGEEWKDWERMIGWVMSETDWSHPSRMEDERAFAWEIDYEYVDMPGSELGCIRDGRFENVEKNPGRTCEILGYVYLSEFTVFGAVRNQEVTGRCRRLVRR